MEGDHLTAGVAKPLFDVHSQRGQRFVLPHRRPADTQPVSVILNWPELLRK